MAARPLSPTLFIVEGYADIPWLRSNLSENGVVLALTPQAQSQLQGAQVPHANTLEFFGQEGHHMVLETSEAMVGKLSNAFQGVNRPPVRAAFVNLLSFSLRFRLRYWLAMLHIVDRACKQFGSKALILCTSADNSHAESLAPLMSAYASANGLEYRQRREAPHKFSGLASSTPAWLDGVLFELSFWWARRRFKGRHPVMAAGPTYGMPNLVSRMRQALVSAPVLYLTSSPKFVSGCIKQILQGQVSVFWNTRAFLNRDERSLVDRQLRAMGEQVCEIPKSERDRFTCNGVFLGDCIERFLLDDLVGEAKQLHAEAKGIERIAESLKPMLAVSQHALGQHGALGEICQAKGIPSLLVTHGSHVPQDDTFAYKEWSSHAKTIFNANFGRVAVQTPWAEKFLRQQETLAKTLQSGPLLFAAPSGRGGDRAEWRKKCYGITPNSSNSFVVLHAGTPKPWSSFRPWVYETTDEYLQNINDLIAAAEQVAGIHVAIRFRPSPSLTLKAFKSLIKPSPIAAIYTEGVFTDYLRGADMLVSYSSTTIEEALQNEVPVLLYDPDGKYHHLPGQRLQPGKPAVPDTVYHVDNRAELGWALTQLAGWRGQSAGRQEGPDWSRHRLPVRPMRECLLELGIPESSLKKNE